MIFPVFAENRNEHCCLSQPFAAQPQLLPQSQSLSELLFHLRINHTSAPSAKQILHLETVYENNLSF
jgi:hypothetical protein